MGKSLSKDVKKMTGKFNPLGFTGSKGAKRITSKGSKVKSKAKKDAKKLGF